MTNREVASMFNLLSRLKELHGENPFRTRAYSSAYVSIRKLPYEVLLADGKTLIQVDGIGKTIVDKIIELRDKGSIQALEEYLSKTPEGVVEMLQIKGFGPKKVRTVWKEMDIETPGELLYACNENRLVELKGFGAKTQESLKKQIAYYLVSKGKYLYGHIESTAVEILKKLADAHPAYDFAFTGLFRRKMPVLGGIDIVTSAAQEMVVQTLSKLEGIANEGEQWFYADTRLTLHHVRREDWGMHLFQHGGSNEFIEEFYRRYGQKQYLEESLYFSTNQLEFIPSEAREGVGILDLAKVNNIKKLIDYQDIRGVVHTHTTFSDGTNSLEEMVQSTRTAGYDYIVISDHSKAAFYANGLTEDRVFQQMEAIDAMNQDVQDFKIYKSIECDILNDGSLDYGDDFLSHFDLVIASIHSNLKMDLEKAMHRLMTAIANPHTRILGHLTGRLLLSREGYPVDHRTIIDACAEYGVAIEINASPYRLDLDWTWVGYALEKQVLLSINPDAHSTAGIADIRYGVDAARKGGLLKKYCLNAKTIKEFDAWINNR